MKHHASPSFWQAYNPQHPSLHLKRVQQYLSVRVGRRHRALGIPTEDSIVWFWIGSHADYDRLLR